MTTRPDTITERDWISDAGLERIGELVAGLPREFDLNNKIDARLTKRGRAEVTVRIEFPDGDVLNAGSRVGDLLQAAMLAECLLINLRAERALRAGGDGAQP